MREIKFRYVFVKEGLKPLYQILSLEEIEHGILERIPGWKIQSKDRYTGFKDRNGVEVCEGDIVQIGNEYFEIKYFDYIGAFTPTNEEGENLDGWYMQVVGNIYENLELLKNIESDE